MISEHERLQACLKDLRHRRSWTAKDDDLLRKFHAEGKTDADIEYILGRDRHTIGIHRRALGLSPNTFRNTAGYRHTPESKAKIGEASKARWENPAFRERQLPILRKGTEASLENRVKPPARNTVAGKIYRKVREALGRSAAHKLLGS